jgi:hypothetical protein
MALRCCKAMVFPEQMIALTGGPDDRRIFQSLIFLAVARARGAKSAETKAKKQFP